MSTLPSHQEALNLDEDEKNNFRELFSFDNKYTSQEYKIWGLIFDLSPDLKTSKQILQGIKEYYNIGMYLQ